MSVWSWCLIRQSLWRIATIVKTTLKNFPRCSLMFMSTFPSHCSSRIMKKRASLWPRYSACLSNRLITNYVTHTVLRDAAFESTSVLQLSMTTTMQAARLKLRPLLPRNWSGWHRRLQTWRTLYQWRRLTLSTALLTSSALTTWSVS